MPASGRYGVARLSEVRDVGALEPLAQLGDALGGVGAVAIAADAAELGVAQAASKGEGGGGCQRGLA